MMQKMKNEDGAALVLAMMVLLVLSILGAMLGTLTVGSYRLSANNQEFNSAYYIAEAGANMAYEELVESINYANENTNENPVNFFNRINNTRDSINKSEGYTGFEKQYGKEPKAIIKVTDKVLNNESKEYTIESTGIVGGKSRTVAKTLEVNWIDSTPSEEGIKFPPSDTVITFKENLTLMPNAKVIGKIRYNGNYKTNTDIKGSLSADPINDLTLNWEDYTFSSNEDFPNPPQQTIMSSMVITTDKYVQKLTVKNELIIDTRGKDINLWVDKLELSSNSTIKILGGGKVNIIYIGEETLKIPSGFMYEGPIISRSSINFEKHYSSSISGIFITESNIIIEGNNNGNKAPNLSINGLLYAPKGKVEINNHVTFNGVILAETVDLSNHVDVNYKKINSNKFPFLNDNKVNEKELIFSNPIIEQ